MASISSKPSSPPEDADVKKSNDSYAQYEIRHNQ